MDVVVISGGPGFCVQADSIIHIHCPISTYATLRAYNDDDITDQKT